MSLGVETKTGEGRFQAAVTQAIGNVCGREVLQQGFSLGRILALFGKPALHGVLIGKFVQGGSVTWNIEQRQPAAVVLQADYVGSDITVDIEQGRLYDGRFPGGFA
ncbi:hypothetical protein D3C81_1821390 [compost metagenome]